MLLRLLLLAQEIPDTDALKGDEKEILIWIIGVLIAAFAGLLTRHLLRERYWESERKAWAAEIAAKTTPVLSFDLYR